MKTLLTLFVATALGTSAFAASGGSAEMDKTDLVPTGTYSGTAHKVDAEEKEIYVKTADGKTLELYLKGDTRLTRGGETVTFDALKEGQPLKVEVENTGKTLKPVAVEITDKTNE